MEKVLKLSTETYSVSVPDLAEGQKYRVIGNRIVDENSRLIGLKEEERQVRTIELNMLLSLANVAYKNAKNITDSRCLMNVYAQLENVEDGESEIKLEERDIKSLVSAYESTSGNRSDEWWRCRDMLKQLENPGEMRGQ